MNFILSMGRGVRILMALLVGGYLLGFILSACGVNVPLRLGLTPVRFWSGDYWQPFTYWLFPAGLFDLLMNVFVLCILGRRIEDEWGSNQIVTFACIVATLAGLLAIWLPPGGTITLMGGAVVSNALMAAWIRLYGHEMLTLSGIGTVSVRSLFLAALLLGFLLAILMNPGWQTFLMQIAALSGAIMTWIYLFWRWKRNMQMEAVPLTRGRTARLEL